MIDVSTISSSSPLPPAGATAENDSFRNIPAPFAPAANTPRRASLHPSRPIDGANLLQAQEARGSNSGELTEEEQRIVRELQQIDREVRRHEQAHRAAGGPYASAPTYQYTRGPDGRLYAVSGEVKIDISPESSPEATIRKMEVVIRAAQAPADPSAQDRAVANKAKAILIEAQAELRAKQLEEQQGASQFPSILPEAASQAYRDAASVGDRAAQARTLISLVTQA